MNAMKKVIMLLIGAALVLSFAGAGAAIDVTEESGSQDVPVTMSGATGNYVLSLPSTITVNQDGSINSDAEYKLVVKEGIYNNEFGPNLTVSVNSDNKLENNYLILNATSGDSYRYVEYGICITESPDDTYYNDLNYYTYKIDSEGHTILWNAYSSTSGKIATVLKGALNSEYYFVGFSGTLTFSVTTNY